MADGLVIMIAGSGGSTGVTTYAENMGVMVVTRVYSTLVFVAARHHRAGAGLVTC
jgi:xanthine/uracil permease